MTHKVFSEKLYDVYYTKEKKVTIIGILFLILTSLAIIDTRFQFFNFSLLEKWGIILLIRISLAKYVFNIAQRQNRRVWVWFIFAFLLPSITLIIISRLNKIHLEIPFDPSKSIQENSTILTEKAEWFMGKRRLGESIRFAKKAIELNPNNEKAYEILRKTYIPQY